MTSKQAPSWLPKRTSSKVELPSKYRYQKRSSRIRDRVGSVARDLDFVPKIVALSKDESPKDVDPIAPSVAIETYQPVSRTTKSAAKKGKQKAAPKQKEKVPTKKD